MAKHIGIAAVTSEGAALCYRTICQEGEAQNGYAHPEVTLHNLSLADYMRSIEAEDWPAVVRLLLESAEKLARIGAHFAICPDNTAHQGLNLVRKQSPIPWLHIAEEIAALAKQRGYSKVGVLGTRWLMTEADLAIQLVLDPVHLLCVRPRLGPEVARVGRVATELERDQMILLVAGRAAPDAVLAHLPDLQVVGVVGRRPDRARPAAHADRRPDRRLGDIGVDDAGRARPAGKQARGVRVTVPPHRVEREGDP